MTTSTTEQAHGAHVRVPPPLLFAAPFAALSALGSRWPLRIPGGALTQALGGVLLGAGGVLGAAGALTFRGHHTTVIPHHRVSALVTSGPYEVTRNPMYTALTLAYTGGALLRRSWWPLLGLPLAVGAVQRLAVEPEEAYLRERFPEEFAAYERRVPRWL